MRHLIPCAALVAAAALIAPPAHADLGGGSIEHVSPDNGLDSGFVVFFQNGDRAVINEGEHSDHYQPDGEENVVSIRVRKGTEIWCLEGYRTPKWIKWHTAGLHTVNGGTNKLCRTQAD